MIKQKDDILIDIETFGTEDDAVIVSIGAIIFNVGDVPGSYKAKFDVKIDVRDQKGRTIDADTVLWWMKDDMEDARKAALFRGTRKRLGLALKELDDFITAHKPNRAWGCAPDFDMGILDHAYKAHGQKFPIPFYKWRDVRTVEDFFYCKNTRKDGGENWYSGTAHDAIDDCIMEASVLQKCWQAAQNVTM